MFHYLVKSFTEAHHLSEAKLNLKLIARISMSELFQERFDKASKLFDRSLLGQS